MSRPWISVPLRRADRLVRLLGWRTYGMACSSIRKISGNGGLSCDRLGISDRSREVSRRWDWRCDWIVARRNPGRQYLPCTGFRDSQVHTISFIFVGNRLFRWTEFFTEHERRGLALGLAGRVHAFGRAHDSVCRGTVPET